MNDKDNIGHSQKIVLAIQGYEGCFHQEAAQTFYGHNVGVVCCANFRDVVKIAADPTQSTGGIMAIENSIAGSILPNYNLLQQSKLKIVGEVYLQIKQNLLVNHGVSLADIKEVHSHPMAIQQCFGFLDQYHWKLVETEDTALSAKHIKQHHSKHIAAIASELAGQIYNLHNIAPAIHTLKNNYTRFLVLQRDTNVPQVTDANKASITFNTNHAKGSLAKVLTVIAAGGINLSKLQSMPIQGSDFKYQFYADLEFLSQAVLEAVLADISPITEALQILGIYKNGKIN
ncbi:MAG: chorismate mutase [Sphingobacteriales bacterium]|nr:MAG: chorismate mutase [Sphingobacteriales bacterium]TAF79291.1 MAG: chorismate mutase [Sphingobacteriales bacterium]